LNEVEVRSTFFGQFIEPFRTHLHFCDTGFGGKICRLEWVCLIIATQTASFIADCLKANPQFTRRTVVTVNKEKPAITINPHGAKEMSKTNDSRVSQRFIGVPRAGISISAESLHQNHIARQSHQTIEARQHCPRYQLSLDIGVFVKWYTCWQKKVKRLKPAT
jgi:hypothetical protein